MPPRPAICCHSYYSTSLICILQVTCRLTWHIWLFVSTSHRWWQCFSVKQMCCHPWGTCEGGLVTVACGVSNNKTGVVHWKNRTMHKIHRFKKQADWIRAVIQAASFGLLFASCLCSSTLKCVFSCRTWQSEADFCGSREHQRQLFWKRR